MISSRSSSSCRFRSRFNSSCRRSLRSSQGRSSVRVVAYTDWQLDVKGCTSLHVTDQDGNDTIVAHSGVPKQCFAKPIHIPANSATTAWLHGVASDVQVELTSDERGLSIRCLGYRKEEDDADVRLLIDETPLVLNAVKELVPGATIRISEPDEERHSPKVDWVNTYVVTRDAKAHA